MQKFCVLKNKYKKGVNNLRDVYSFLYTQTVDTYLVYDLSLNVNKLFIIIEFVKIHCLFKKMKIYDDDNHMLYNF